MHDNKRITVLFSEEGHLYLYLKNKVLAQNEASLGLLFT